MNRIFDIRKHSPRQNESSSPKNPIFKVPRARNCKNDKFVTVGVPEAETIAYLIFFLHFEAVQLYQKLPWSQKSNLDRIQDRRTQYPIQCPEGGGCALESKQARCASPGSLRSLCVHTAPVRVLNVQCTLLEGGTPPSPKRGGMVGQTGSSLDKATKENVDIYLTIYGCAQVRHSG